MNWKNWSLTSFQGSRALHWSRWIRCCFQFSSKKSISSTQFNLKFLSSIWWFEARALKKLRTAYREKTPHQRTQSTKHFSKVCCKSFQFSSRMLFRFAILFLSWFYRRSLNWLFHPRSKYLRKGWYFDSWLFPVWTAQWICRRQMSEICFHGIQTFCGGTRTANCT